MKEFTTFMKSWQTLIGGALGTFLAVIFSVLGFWIKSIIEEKKKRRESLRRIDVAITRGLNDIYTAREKLKQFVKSIRTLVNEANAISNNKTFFFNRINFPTIREIYRDTDTPSFRVKSYYLYNNFLFVDAGIKEMNKTLSDNKNYFEILIRQNEILITLMNSNSNSNPAIQIKTYVDNLEDFAKGIEDYCSKHIKQNIKIMTQIKVYTSKLRKKHGDFILWQYEGTRFKYFRNKTEQKKYAQNFDSFERIDQILQKEVESAIEEAEKQFTKSSDS